MDIFAEVKSRVTIRQVVEHYGSKVDRAGKFTCPFHNDKHPSAGIKNDYFHCFVCGAGGDSITFTAKYLGMSNLDAAKELVRAFGLNIDTSTPEERKARREEEKMRREEIRQCDSLREMLMKDKNTRSEIRKPTLYKLRNEVKKINVRKEQEQKEYMRRVWFILADMHRFLWKGVQMYPYEHKLHIRGLQELTVCEYYIDCYDYDAELFCREYKGVIDRYAKEIKQWESEGF